MQEDFEMQEVSMRRRPAREAMQRAHGALSGHAVCMVLALLFCLTASYAIYLFTALLGGALISFLSNALLIVTLYYGAIALAVVCLFLPLWAGYLRMAGLVVACGACEPRELFYYFRSARLFLRGIGVALLSVLSLLFPPCFAAAALYAGKEALSFSGALREAFATRERFATVIAFWAHILCHLIFSVLTLGVLWVLYYAHHSAVAYFTLAMGEERE